MLFNKQKNLEEQINTLSEYVMTNKQKIYRLIYSYVKKEETALDILQDAIVKAIRKIGTLKNQEYMATWFYRIAINESLTYLRKHKTNQTFSIENYEMLDNKSETTKELSTALDLYQAIDKLEPKLKTIIVLRFYENKKLDEIADITNTNVSTVKSRLYKALNILKIEMKEEETEI